MSISTTPNVAVDHGDIAGFSECPLCHKDRFGLEEKKVLGLLTFRSWVCVSCGAAFKKSRDGYRLVGFLNRTSPTWENYGNQTLFSREWKTIGDGGMSDAKQKEADMELWMSNLRSGKIKVQCIGAPSSLILQKDETLLCAIPNVTLKEPRSVRVSRGSYGGPSIRVAKGLYFRVGSFGSTSRSHSEIKNIDNGILSVTDKRFAFSGKMKSVTVDLRKIASIDPFSDGITLHREGYQRTQYFTWQGDVATLTIGASGRDYKEPFSGLILQYLIEGAAANFRK